MKPLVQDPGPEPSWWARMRARANLYCWLLGEFRRAWRERDE